MILVLLVGGLGFLWFWNQGDGLTESPTISFSDIRDGKDITFIAIELAEESAIPWTKPVDVVYDEQFPNFDDELQLANPAYIALGDGGIFSLPITPEIDRETFRKSISISGGKHVVRGDVLKSSSYYPNGKGSSKRQRASNRKDAEAYAQEALARVERMKRFRKVMQALHSYHRDKGHLPPAVVYGEDGKPRHSWRVLILPYMAGQNYIYEQYDFSVPWDAPQNQKILELIPEPYVYGQFPSPTNYDTCIALITGEGTAFPLTSQ